MKKSSILKIKTIPEIKEIAKKKIFYKTWNWLECGSASNETVEKNISYLKEIKLIPRILRYNYKSFALKKLFNCNLDFPLIISPMGHLTQFHKNGESELALGAEISNTIITISCLTRLKLSEIKKRAKRSKIFYQIYFYNNKKWVLEQIKKALEVNVSGFVVTLDSPVTSLKYQTLSDNYDARKYGRRTNYSNIEKQAFLLKWKDILWFKKQIKSKPMVIKGIMHPEDAAKAFKYKADAIWVSNHGGRVFNSIISPFEVLPSIRKKVGKSKIIIVDGGIRSGADIVKACHLGANIVSIGRPAIYGLIASGSIGVKKLFDILKKDYFISKKLSGY